MDKEPKEEGQSIDSMIKKFLEENPQIGLLFGTKFSQDFETLRPRLERLKQVLAETKFTGRIYLEAGTHKTGISPNLDSIFLNIEEADWEDKFRQNIPEAVRRQEFTNRILEVIKGNSQIFILFDAVFTQDFETLRPRLERLKQVLAETKFTGRVFLGTGTSKTSVSSDSDSIFLNIEEADWENKFRNLISSGGAGSSQESDPDLPPPLPVTPELTVGQYIAEVGNKERKEWSIKTKLAKIFGISDYGGKGSKYSKENSKRETVNEDSMFGGEVVDSNGQVVIGVIDGAGGSGNGRLASEIANKEFYTRLITLGKDNPDLVTVMLETSEIIRRDGKKGFACAVIARINPDSKVELAWSGDSKAMTIRKGEKVSEGTTELQNAAIIFLQEVEGDGDLSRYYNNDEIPDAFANYRIAGSLGGREDGEKPAQLNFDAQNGDQIIMASDGLWDVVTEYEIIELSKKYKGERLRQQLFDLAFKRNNSEKGFKIRFSPDKEIDMKPKFGNGDNITIQVVEVILPEPIPEPTPIVSEPKPEPIPEPTPVVSGFRRSLKDLASSVGSIFRKKSRKTGNEPVVSTDKSSGDAEVGLPKVEDVDPVPKPPRVVDYSEKGNILRDLGSKETDEKTEAQAHLDKMLSELDSQVGVLGDKASKVGEDMKGLRELLEQLKTEGEEGLLDKFKEYWQKYYLVVERLKSLQTEITASLSWNSKENGAEEMSSIDIEKFVGDLKDFQIFVYDNPGFSTGNRKIVQARIRRVQDLIKTIGYLERVGFVGGRFGTGIHKDTQEIQLNIERSDWEEKLKELLLKKRIPQEIESLAQSLNDKIFVYNNSEFNYAKFEETKNKLPRLVQLLQVAGYNRGVGLAGNLKTQIWNGNIQLNIEESDWEEKLKEMLEQQRMREQVFMLIKDDGRLSLYSNSIFDKRSIVEMPAKIVRLKQLLDRVGFTGKVGVAGMNVGFTVGKDGKIQVDIDNPDWERQLVVLLKASPDILREKAPASIPKLLDSKIVVPDKWPPTDGKTPPPTDFDPTKPNWDIKIEGLDLSDLDFVLSGQTVEPDKISQAPESVSQEAVVEKTLVERLGNFTNRVLEAVSNVGKEIRERTSASQKKDVVLGIVDFLNKTVGAVAGTKILGDAALYAFGKGDIYALRQGKKEIEEIKQALREYQKNFFWLGIYKSKDLSNKNDQEKAHIQNEITEMEQELQEKADALRKKIESAKHLDPEAQARLLTRLDEILEKHKQDQDSFQSERDRKMQAEVEAYLTKKVSEIGLTRDALSLLALPTGMIAARGIMYAGAALVERGRKAIAEAQRNHVEDEKVNRALYILKDVFLNSVRETVTLGSWSKKGHRDDNGVWMDDRSKSERVQDRIKAFSSLFRMVGIGGTTMAEINHGVFEQPINNLIATFREGHILDKLMQNTQDSLVQSTQMIHSPVQTVKKIFHNISGLFRGNQTGGESMAASNDSVGHSQREVGGTAGDRDLPPSSGRVEPQAEAGQDQVQATHEQPTQVEPRGSSAQPREEVPTQVRPEPAAAEANEKPQVDSPTAEHIESGDGLRQFLAETKISSNGQEALRSLVGKYPELNNKDSLDSIWHASANSGSLENDMVDRDARIFNMLVNRNQAQAVKFLTEDLGIKVDKERGLAESLLKKAGGAEQFVRDYLAGNNKVVLRDILHRADATIIANQVKGVDFSKGYDVGMKGESAHILGIKDGKLIIENGKQVLFEHKDQAIPVRTPEPEPAPQPEPVRTPEPEPAPQPEPVRTPEPPPEPRPGDLETSASVRRASEPAPIIPEPTPEPAPQPEPIPARDSDAIGITGPRRVVDAIPEPPPEPRPGDLETSASVRRASEPAPIIPEPTPEPAPQPEPIPARDSDAIGITGPRRGVDAIPEPPPEPRPGDLETSASVRRASEPAPIIPEPTSEPTSNSEVYNNIQNHNNTFIEDTPQPKAIDSLPRSEVVSGVAEDQVLANAKGPADKVAVPSDSVPIDNEHKGEVPVVERQTAEDVGSRSVDQVDASSVDSYKEFDVKPLVPGESINLTMGKHFLRVSTGYEPKFIENLIAFGRTVKDDVSFEHLTAVMKGTEGYKLEYNPDAKDPAEMFRVLRDGRAVVGK